MRQGKKGKRNGRFHGFENAFQREIFRRNHRIYRAVTRVYRGTEADYMTFQMMIDKERDEERIEMIKNTLTEVQHGYTKF